MYYNKEQHEELYSQQVNAGKRKYYFDVKETRAGDQFITITESRKMFDNNSGTFYYERNKMFLYKEDFENFQKALQNAFTFIETGEMAPEAPESDNNGDDYRYDERRSQRQDRHYDNRNSGFDSYDSGFESTFDDFHINEI